MSEKIFNLENQKEEYKELLNQLLEKYQNTKDKNDNFVNSIENLLDEDENLKKIRIEIIKFLIYEFDYLKDKLNQEDNLEDYNDEYYNYNNYDAEDEEASVFAFLKEIIESGKEEGLAVIKIFLEDKDIKGYLDKDKILHILKDATEDGLEIIKQIFQKDEKKDRDSEILKILKDILDTDYLVHISCAGKIKNLNLIKKINKDVLNKLDSDTITIFLCGSSPGHYEYDFKLTDADITNLNNKFKGKDLNQIKYILFKEFIDKEKKLEEDKKEIKEIFKELFKNKASNFDGIIQYEEKILALSQWPSKLKEILTNFEQDDIDKFFREGKLDIIEELEGSPSWLVGLFEKDTLIDIICGRKVRYTNGRESKDIVKKEVIQAFKKWQEKLGKIFKEKLKKSSNNLFDLLIQAEPEVVRQISSLIQKAENNKDILYILNNYILDICMDVDERGIENLKNLLEKKDIIKILLDSSKKDKQEDYILKIIERLETPVNFEALDVISNKIKTKDLDAVLNGADIVEILFSRLDKDLFFQEYIDKNKEELKPGDLAKNLKDINQKVEELLIRKK